MLYRLLIVAATVIWGSSFVIVKDVTSYVTPAWILVIRFSLAAIILAVVTLFAWLLGGPIGIGTLICAFLEGPIMQLDFKIVRFDPTVIVHQNIFDSFKVIFKK